MQIHVPIHDPRDGVRLFLETIAKEPGLFSVKSLCSFVVDNCHWKDLSDIIDYLRDYLTVSEAKLAFHSHWTKLPDMKNLAMYDRREIDMILQLIEKLNLER